MPAVKKPRNISGESDPTATVYPRRVVDREHIEEGVGSLFREPFLRLSRLVPQLSTDISRSTCREGTHWQLYESKSTSREGLPAGRDGACRAAAGTAESCCRASFCCMLSACRCGASLDPDKPIRQYIHQTWQTSQGLPQNSVLAVAQTPDGYLWLGTEEGFARFDGTHFTIFDKHVSGLQTDQIQALYVDRENNLWIGSNGGGLSSYSHGKFTPYTSANGLSNIRSMRFMKTIRARFGSERTAAV